MPDAMRFSYHQDIFVEISDTSTTSLEFKFKFKVTCISFNKWSIQYELFTNVCIEEGGMAPKAELVIMGMPLQY